MAEKRYRTMALKLFISILSVSLLVNCNLSSKYFQQNSPCCSKYYDVISNELPVFVKNKKFREVYKYLKEEYGAKQINLIFYVESKKIYYTEFYINHYTVICLILDDNLKEISKEEIIYTTKSGLYNA